MPSTRPFAALVALLVILSGCNALPSTDQSSAPKTTAHQVGYLSSSDHAYNATITVTDPAGDTVTERHLSFDGEQARYVDLATLNDTGNYTVSVQTDIPAVGGGEMSADHSINVTAGQQASVVHTTYHDISITTGTARNRSTDTALTYMWAIPRPGQFTYQLHRGDTLITNDSMPTRADTRAPQEVGTIERTGVYWIAATTNYTHDTTYHVGVVNESTTEVRFMVEHGGDAKVQFVVGDDGGFASRPPIAPPASTPGTGEDRTTPAVR